MRPRSTRRRSAVSVDARQAPRSTYWFGIFGTVVAIVDPALLALIGLGMSPQPTETVFNGAFASLLAIISGFLVIRRLLRFPLLPAYGYVALTFVSTFALVAVGLKFLRIEYSSPQFFAAMVMITGLSRVFLLRKSSMGANEDRCGPRRNACGQAAKVARGSVEISDAEFSSKHRFRYTAGWLPI